MGYQEEQEILDRVYVALRDALPARADAINDRVKKWFVWHWRGEPATSNRSAKCALCDHMLAALTARWNGALAVGWNHDDRLGNGSPGTGVCDDCLDEAVLIAENPQHPLRDMIRADANRALDAAEDEGAKRVIEKLAESYPDLRREEGTCSVYGAHAASLVRGARAGLCAPCLRGILNHKNDPDIANPRSGEETRRR